jgi:hypothetical protein
MIEFFHLEIEQGIKIQDRSMIVIEIQPRIEKFHPACQVRHLSGQRLQAPSIPLGIE